MAGKRNFLSVSGAVEYVKEVFLFNIDDLGRIREATPARCRQHIAPAEQVIDRLTCDFEQKRESESSLARSPHEFPGCVAPFRRGHRRSATPRPVSVAGSCAKLDTHNGPG